MPVETQGDGESTIVFQCNGCGQVLGTLSGMLARALALELVNDLVVSRMDEKDPSGRGANRNLRRMPSPSMRPLSRNVLSRTGARRTRVLHSHLPEDAICSGGQDMS